MVWCHFLVFFGSNRSSFLCVVDTLWLCTIRTIIVKSNTTFSKATLHTDSSSDFIYLGNYSVCEREKMPRWIHSVIFISADGAFELWPHAAGIASCKLNQCTFCCVSHSAIVSSVSAEKRDQWLYYRPLTETLLMLSFNNISLCSWFSKLALVLCPLFYTIRTHAAEITVSQNENSVIIDIFSLKIF